MKKARPHRKKKSQPQLAYMSVRRLSDWVIAIVEIKDSEGIRTAMAGDGRAGIGLINVLEAFFLKSLFYPSDDLVVLFAIDGMGDEDDFLIWVIEGLEGLFDIIWAPLLDWATEFLAAFHLTSIRFHQDLWAEMKEVSAESGHCRASSSFVEEVDGLEAEGSLVVWDTFLNKFDDLFWGFARFDELSGIDAFKSDTSRKRTAIDDMDFATKGLSSIDRIVIGTGNARAKADMDFLVIVFENALEELGVFHLVDGASSAKLSGLHRVIDEVFAGDNAIRFASFTKGDGERDGDDVIFLEKFLREVAGRLGRDCDFHYYLLLKGSSKEY